MDGFQVENALATIGEVIRQIAPRALPLIHEGSPIDDVIDAMDHSPHSRLVYVVDGENHLLGTISLGTLVRHIFSASHEPRIHPKSLLSMITSETASDIMARHPISATVEETVGEVMKRMVAKNVKEIAVVDAEDHVIADITMIDLLKCRS
jgi:CBS domain-containing protein